MSITPLRQKFLDLQSDKRIPMRQIPLSSRESLAEYQVELDRIERIHQLDGEAEDLIERQGAVEIKGPGADRFYGSVTEFQFANRNKPFTEYTTTQTTDIGPKAREFGHALETVVMGSNDRDEGIWTCQRLCESPGRISLEKVYIHYADPGKSYKEVWEFAG